MASSSPYSRQSSLLGTADFSTEPPLEIEVAKNRFNRIVDHFDTVDDPGNQTPYNRSKLIRFTYQYALSEQSQENVLRAFFRTMALSTSDVDFDINELRPKFFSFADDLLDNFFLPLKAYSKKTPQPTPTYHSAVQEVQRLAPDCVGRPARVSALRGQCLLRDRHRCVITRKFDLHEGLKRSSRSNDARDDDGNLLTGDFACLEVAHILPHSLTKANANHELDKPREAALAILNMFDHGVTHLIDGTNIDQPRNALTLTHDMHQLFGSFKIFFDPVQDEPHTYRINSFLPPSFAQYQGLPVTRTLYLTDTRTIDPPSPRLLAVHRAIAHILHLSAAGEYIDRLLRDFEERGIQADGSTHLARLVNLSLSGWLDKSAG